MTWKEPVKSQTAFRERDYTGIRGYQIKGARQTNRNGIK